MTDFSTDYAKVRNLLPGETCLINWSEEGGAEIFSDGDYFYLYHVPQYGGESRLVRKCRFVIDEIGIKTLIAEAHSWT